MTSEDSNKQIVLQFYEEVWNRGNYAFALDLFADTPAGRQDHGTASANSGPIQAKLAEGIRSLCPDLVMTVEHLIAEGDLVAARWRMTATHARTGTRIDNYTGVNLWTFRNGRVVEICNNRDDLELFHQLGLIPSRESLFAQIGGGGYDSIPGRQQLRSEAA